MTHMTTQLRTGDKIYYPSVKGMALLCEVIDKSEKDVLVSIDDKQFYLPNESVNAHAIVIDEARAKAYVAQRVEDPANKIVYLRYLWDETWVDRAYNDFCRSRGRIEEPHIIEAVDVEAVPDPMAPLADY